MLHSAADDGEEGSGIMRRFGLRYVHAGS
jgi:hypothetical protein